MDKDMLDNYLVQHQTPDGVWHDRGPMNLKMSKLWYKNMLQMYPVRRLKIMEQELEPNPLLKGKYPCLNKSSITSKS